MEEILEWKYQLMAELNNNIFRKTRWLLFIEKARALGYEAIANDMQKRYNYYETRRHDD